MSTFLLSAAAACWRPALVARWVGFLGLKSPMTPMRTIPILLPFIDLIGAEGERDADAAHDADDLDGELKALHVAIFDEDLGGDRAGAFLKICGPVAGEEIAAGEMGELGTNGHHNIAGRRPNLG